MSELQDEVRNGLSLGVLIIGSLYWDPCCHRKKWRRDRLDQCNKRYVRAPIRYGRLSKSGLWRDSYTMVFSSGLGADQYGHAIVVPCKHRVHGGDDLIHEAKCLWAAEAKTKPGDPKKLSASWGCVGLLPNPERPLPADVRACWKQQVSCEPCYGILNAVSESGFLKIPWPKSEDGAGLEFDVLLATATDPTICNGRYPTPQKIAEAWNNHDGSVEYFKKNRKHNIRTCEDDCIEALLSK